MCLAEALEAVLFASEAPLKPEELATALSATRAEVLDTLQRLGARLESSSGLRLIQIAGGYQLCTKPEHAEAVTRVLQPHRPRIGRSQMEVLAIVAYKQPITLAEIDAIRGVQSDSSLRQLVDRRLVQDIGRKPTPGRPLLYGTTRQFLHEFRLDSLDQLPAPDDGKTVDIRHALQGALDLP